jgi:hypothetical protein
MIIVIGTKIKSKFLPGVTFFYINRNEDNVIENRDY